MGTSPYQRISETWQELCAKAAVEPDPQRLLELVEEINRILEHEKERERQNTGTDGQ